MSDRRRCPRCGSTDVVPIVYGLPSDETVAESYAGTVVLGGCLIYPDAPDSCCRRCETAFTA